jgi:predicted ATPase/class 3 adenylate cyclase
MASQLDSGAPVSARPTGTVAFLFTDIEGSTERWERNREAMAAALARHDALMRAAMEVHGAYVFKTMGDAFCTVFATPLDALAAALDAQRALAREDFAAVEGLRVRMALHAGNADERDGDYFGPSVNRVARLLAVGHGGQVLLSDACTKLIANELPPEYSLRDLGEHRLKDLAQPERIHQLLAPDLFADFPPLRSLEHLSNNLPAQVSSFLGRVTEIAEVTALIEQHRLVTLGGSGGVGKTRLSLHVAADLIDSFSDGVWFVELAPLARGDYIPTTVASALGVKLPPEGDPVKNLIRAIKGKHALLLFDNCEHLVESAARVISAILHGAPKLKVLASSRQTLGVAGEATYQVPSLALPAKNTGHLSAIDVLRYESIALFVERARAASDRFSLADENAPIVADICRRLDGIPLAIELAAARVKMLSPQQLRERLDERFRVLTDGSRDMLPRQQTLRALIDWSYDLLDKRERVLFRRLGIFVNGFALEGAAAVGSDEPRGELDVFDVLASLVDKSLVLAEPQGDALRYRLLESTRAYALEKLDAAGERDQLAGRHLRYLRDRFAELWELTQRTARSVDLGAALQIEMEDLRSALDGARVRRAVADGGELLAKIGARWRLAGLNAEGTTRLEAYLAALPAGESRLRAQLLSSLSFLLGESGRRVQALEMATLAVEHARASFDSPTLAGALHRYAHNAMFLNRLDDAELALAEAEAIPGASANFRMVLLEARACLIQLRGDLETAARMLEQLRKECRALGDDHTEQVAALNLAEVEHARGHTQRAIAIIRELLSATRSGADNGQLALLLQNLAGYLVTVDDPLGAGAAAREAIQIHAARDPGHALVAATIEHLALAVALGGDDARGAILEGYADAALGRCRFVREFTEATTHDRLTALLRKGLMPNELARLIAEGAALTPQAAIAVALAEDDPT